MIKFRTIKINKKIILYFTFSLIIALAVTFIGDNPRYIIPTSSLPISKHIIVLDAGHGKPDRTVQKIKKEYQKNK